MAVHSIKTVQKIPVSKKEAWDFFATPVNLQTITPAAMGFRILSTDPAGTIYPGRIIEYRVSPLFGIPLRWVTEIAEVDELKFFVDVQIKGPYCLWRHQHHFADTTNGVEMIDIVHYANPFGMVGEAANHLFVKNKLRSIFEFRFRKVEELLGKWDGQEMKIEIK